MSYWSVLGLSCDNIELFNQFTTYLNILQDDHTSEISMTHPWVDWMQKASMSHFELDESTAVYIARWLYSLARIASAPETYNSVSISC